MSSPILFIPHGIWPDLTPNKEEDEPFNPFKFTELRLFSKRLIITTIVIFILILCVHFWSQFLCIGLVYFGILSPSENTLHDICSILMSNREASLNLRTRLIIYSLLEICSAYLCLNLLYKGLSQETLPDIIVESVLISLFTYVLIGSMKNIAVAFRFFRVCDIENGSLSLLTMMSIIIRYIFVTPIWFSFLNDIPLNQIPSHPSILSIVYLISKLGGLWILSVDFSYACKQFFKSCLLKAPPGLICQNCEKSPAVFFTQCGHVFCKECIERGRKVEAACPFCKSHIPRKWTMPFKYGALSGIVMFCTL